MISDVAVSPGPQDLTGLNQEHSGQKPGVADDAAAPETFPVRLQGSYPHAWPEKLAKACPADVHALEELSLGIGDCTSLRPSLTEELPPVFQFRREDQDYWRKVRLFFRNPAELFDSLLAEDSAKVAQEYEQCQRVTQFVSQPVRLQVQALHATSK